MNAKSAMNHVVTSLRVAGVSATVVYDGHVVAVDAEDAMMARDVLGFDRYTGYVNDCEVVIV